MDPKFWKKSDHPNPQKKPKKPKKTQKKTYGFSRWDNLPTLWVRRLGFGIQVSSFLKMLGPFFKPRWPYSPYQRSYTLEILHVYLCGKYFRFIWGDFSNSTPKLFFPGVLVRPPGVKNLEKIFSRFFDIFWWNGLGYGF